MSKELYNNLLVIVNMILMFASVGLAIHTFNSHNDIVEGILYVLIAIGFTMFFILRLYQLFKDREDL